MKPQLYSRNAAKKVAIKGKSFLGEFLPTSVVRDGLVDRTDPSHRSLRRRRHPKSRGVALTEIYRIWDISSPRLSKNSSGGPPFPSFSRPELNPGERERERRGPVPSFKDLSSLLWTWTWRGEGRERSLWRELIWDPPPFFPPHPVSAAPLRHKKYTLGGRRKGWASWQLGGEEEEEETFPPFILILLHKASPARPVGREQRGHIIVNKKVHLWQILEEGGGSNVPPAGSLLLFFFSFFLAPPTFLAPVFNWVAQLERKGSKIRRPLNLFFLPPDTEFMSDA